MGDAYSPNACQKILIADTIRQSPIERINTVEDPAFQY